MGFEASLAKRKSKLTATAIQSVALSFLQDYRQSRFLELTEPIFQG